MVRGAALSRDENTSNHQHYKILYQQPFRSIQMTALLVFFMLPAVIILLVFAFSIVNTQGEASLLWKGYPSKYRTPTLAIGNLCFIAMGLYGTVSGLALVVSVRPYRKKVLLIGGTVLSKFNTFANTHIRRLPLKATTFIIRRHPSSASVSNPSAT